jgi:glucose dehydrogenase
MNDISRPGDNLYTVSLVALEIATGKLRWHYQQVPHDVWGYDLASPPVLFNFKQNGKNIVAERRKVKQGLSYNGNVEILEGLNVGDKVITTGYQDLNQGDALLIK